MPKLVVAAVLLLALLRHGPHGEANDRVGLFSTITVEEGQTAGDIACAFCSVNLRGDVRGDMAVLFGNVVADPDRNISGDVAVLFSSMNLGENDRIGGDLAAPFSSVNLPSSATVTGDHVVIPAGGFGLTILLGPILILASAIGLIFFLVRRRRRYPYPV